ncbi:MAG TPA: hypothetical protein PKD23_03530 [Bellilinea sp.]|nr:hypothetical protein [Bellilinea sp.]
MLAVDTAVGVIEGMGELVSVGRGVKVAVAVRVGRKVALVVASPERITTFAWADFGKKRTANAIKLKKAGIAIFCCDVLFLSLMLIAEAEKIEAFLNLNMDMPLFWVLIHINNPTIIDYE